MLAASLMTLLSTLPHSAAMVEEAMNAGHPGRIEIVELREVRATGCSITGLEPFNRPARSSVVALTLTGRDGETHHCSATAVARVRVFDTVLVTTRAVKAGEALEGAVTAQERERFDGAPVLAAADLGPGVLAAQALAPNTLLAPRHVRTSGPATGELLKVVVRISGLRLVQEARVVNCQSASRVCARLPNGHRVEGVLRDGELEVSP